MDTNNTTQTDISTPETSPQISVRAIMASTLIIGLIAGAAGGILGYGFAARHPQVLGTITGSVPPVTQNVRVEEDSAVIDVVKKASPAVVSIVISKDLNKVQNFNSNPFSDFFGFTIPNQQPRTSEPNIQQVGAGSGFFVTADGLILTNRHVVSDEQASYTVVANDGKEYEAKVLARDPVNDLALVKIDISGAPTLTLSDSYAVQAGSRVVAIGNSLGQYQNTVTTGVVSGVGRSITAGGGGEAAEQLEGVIQTDAAINPGNSGGPLLNIQGQVIGINTAIDRGGQSVGFAIPASDAKIALASYQKNGRILRPFIGIRYVIITKELAEKEKLAKDYGALVLRGQTSADPAIVAGSPAEKAGLKENDVILEINGKQINKDSTLMQLLKSVAPGDTVQLKIWRDGKEETISLTVGER